jgi:hypothetical protein
VLIEYLTLNYIFTYFWIAIWLSYQLLIHVCSEANFRKNYFFANFSWFLAFQCEASERTWLIVWTQAALLIANLVVDCSDELVTRSDAILTSIYPSLSFLTSRTPLHFYWFIMSCCVFFSRLSPEILAFSARLFSFRGIFLSSFILLSFLCFLEY